jgi:hypothetical protein
VSPTMLLFGVRLRGQSPLKLSDLGLLESQLSAPVAIATAAKTLRNGLFISQALLHFAGL